MQHVVAIIVPLRVDVLAEVRGIVVVLQHQMHVPPRLHGGAHRGGHLVHPVLIQDGMHRVETQPVEAVLHQPVEHIVGEEAAHLGSAEIDRRSPRCVAILAKELRRVERQVIPVRPEVVVHHVEKDHQTVVVRSIDQ